MSKVLTDQIEKRTGGTAIDLPATGKWPTANIADDAVTYAKLQDTTTANRVLGAAAAGTVGEIQVATDMVADNAVSLAKMAGLARGKIIVGDASGDPSALTVGSANQVLTSDGSDAAWAAAAAGGKIGQVLVVEDATSDTIATTTYTATGLSQAITPSATLSKILCIWTMTAALTGGGSGEGYGVQLNRSISGGANTDIYTSSYIADVYQDQSSAYSRGTYIHLDSPSTTSATTYLVRVGSYNNASITINVSNNQSQLLLMEILA